MSFLDRIKNGWALMGSSWEVLKKDKEILVLPLLSGVFILLVAASFILPLIRSDMFQELTASEGGENASIPADIELKLYGLLFLFYFFSYFIITFFNSAIVACAVWRMSGRDPTVGFGLQAAFERISLIAGWALLAATVGIIIKIIESRSKNLGRLIAGLAGLAWTVASSLAVPVLVIEKKGPFTALKESASLIRKTWGEGLTAAFSFGLLFGLLGFPGIALIIAGIMTGNLPAGITMAIPGALYLAFLKLIQSSLETIFITALYGYAKRGHVVKGFDERAMTGAFRPGMQ